MLPIYYFGFYISGKFLTLFGSREIIVMLVNMSLLFYVGKRRGLYYFCL